MPPLHNKTILILSPQSWGKMFLSKHHYAIELARRGNKVYFLNPPETGSTDLRSPVLITPVTGIDNLFLIRHKLWFPYILKFHALPLFHAGMKWHAGSILKAIGETVDIVWSFDLGNLYPMRFFHKVPRKIFHPVDEPLNTVAIESARGADIIFSVTREILEKYRSFDVPRIFVNHGVTDEFLSSRNGSYEPGNPVRVGLSGNLVRPDIDRQTLLQIIRENSGVMFECWGSYSYSQSNISGSDDEATGEFIAALQSCPNVVLHGAVATGELARQMSLMDAFLICYDINKDQSRGTNYHKIMEYLSTGKVIISNNVTTYKDTPALLQMTEERDNNDQLPSLFKKVIAELQTHNSLANQEARIAFARDNSYSKQLERIAGFIVSS